MMTKLRQSMTLVFIIVIIAFVLFMFLDWGMNAMSSGGPSANGQYVGEAAGVKISQNMLSNAYMEARKNYLAAGNRTSIDEQTEKELENQAFNKVVSDLIFAKIERQNGYAATESEIMGIVMNVPPKELRSDERFFKDGKFDMDLYRQMISSQENREFFSNYYLQVKDQLPKIRFQGDLVSGIKVTADEVIRNVKINETKFQCEYVVLPNEVTAGTEVSDEEAKAYYEENKYLFNREESAVVSMVIIPKTPSSQDVLSAKENIDGIRDDIVSGRITFEHAANMYSDDLGTASKDGLVGYIKRGMTVQEFSDAAFSMKKGQISQPVRTVFGWHIIKCEDVARDSVKVRHILVKVSPSQETVDAIKTRTENFLEKVKRTSLEDAAAEDSLRVIVTMPFNPLNGGIPELSGDGSKIAAFAHEKKAGDISKVIDETSGFAVVRLDSRTDAGIPAYEDIKEQVRSVMVLKKKKILASIDLSEKVKEIKKSGASLEQFAKKNGLQYYKSGLVTAKEGLKGVQSGSPFYGAVFVAEKNGVFYLTGEQKCYIFRVLQREDLTNEKLQKVFESYQQQLVNVKQQMIISDWSRELKEKYNIKDYRI